MRVALVHVLYWYKSTNTDVLLSKTQMLRTGNTLLTLGTQFTCFTGAKVQILTLKAEPGEVKRQFVDESKPTSDPYAGSSGPGTGTSTGTNYVKYELFMYIH
jgi:hypothetical protein